MTYLKKIGKVECIQNKADKWVAIIGSEKHNGCLDFLWEIDTVLRLEEIPEELRADTFAAYSFCMAENDKLAYHYRQESNITKDEVDEKAEWLSQYREDTKVS